METVGAVILAAGNSSRLGEPKQLLHYRGETLIRRAARAALKAHCAPVIVVTGAGHPRIAEELAALDVCILHHPEWARGLGSSIRAGLASALAASPALDALMLMVCDQPWVTAELLTALVAARTQTRQPAAACAYAGIVGVPALFDRTLFPSLAALPDEHGAKQILAANAEAVARVAFPQGAIDIDTPADWRAVSETAAATVRATPPPSSRA